MSLKAYKKNELKEMLQKLSLSTEGLKNDLEDRMQDYLDKIGKSIEDVPELSEYFIDVIASPSTARKAARKSMALITGDDSDSDLKVSEVLPALKNRLEDAAQEIDISPSKVAKWADDTRKKVLSTKVMPKSVSKHIPNVSALRVRLSQGNTVGALAIVTEAALLSKALLPLKYEIKLGGLGAVTLPDLYVALIGGHFWYPVFAWLALQVIPLLIATVINPRAGSVSKRYRKAHSLEYAFDPVTFAIAKMVLTYILFSTSAFSGFAGRQVSTLGYAVGKDTFQISAAVTLIFSLYEAIL